MFRFCLQFSEVAFLEIIGHNFKTKTAHFKAKNFHFNWIACTILRLKMSADITPLDETEQLVVKRQIVEAWLS
jgi:hypothetical protein